MTVHIFLILSVALFNYVVPEYLDGILLYNYYPVHYWTVIFFSSKQELLNLRLDFQT